MKFIVVSLMSLLLMGICYAEEVEQDALPEAEDKPDALTEVEYRDNPDDLADPYSEESPDELQNYEDESADGEVSEKKDPGWVRRIARLHHFKCRRRCSFMPRIPGKYCYACLAAGQLLRRRHSRRRRRGGW